MSAAAGLLRFDVPSPLGVLRGAATGRGVALLALPRGRDDDAHVASALTRLAAGGPTRTGTHALAEQLVAYFAGTLRSFDVPLDLALVAPGTERVLRALCDVPFGELVTYGELARRAGMPGAARAVGRAVGSNPVPIVVPCHRVVAAGARLGGFSGGLAHKRALLALEGHEVRGTDSERWSTARVARRAASQPLLFES